MVEDALVLRQPRSQKLRSSVTEAEDPLLGVGFAAFIEPAYVEPLLQQLQERPGDQLGGGHVRGSLLAKAIKAHGGTEVGRFFEYPAHLPIMRFSASPLVALAMTQERTSAVLVAMMLRQSRVFFFDHPQTIDLIVLAEDHAQLIVWQDGAAPYRIDALGGADACEAGLLNDVRWGNDTLLGQFGQHAFPQPLKFLDTPDLAPPYNDVVGCSLPGLTGGDAGESRGLHLIESSGVTWHDEDELADTAPLIQVEEVRRSERVEGAWEWLGVAPTLDSPVIAYFIDGYRVG